MGGRGKYRSSWANQGNFLKAPHRPGKIDSNDDMPEKTESEARLTQERKELPNGIHKWWEKQDPDSPVTQRANRRKVGRKKVKRFQDPNFSGTERVKKPEGGGVPSMN